MKFYLAAKLHRARVTEANLSYPGSVGIDEELMRVAGIEPYERVQMNNFNNGRTWTTYVIPAPAGSRAICLNGGAARFGAVGDVLVMLTWRMAERFQPAKAVVLNERNEIVRVQTYQDDRLPDDGGGEMSPRGDQELGG